MGLDGDSDLAKLGHGILSRIVGILLNHTFSLRGLRPILLKYTIVYPFLA